MADMSKYSGTIFIKPDDVRAGPTQVRIEDIQEGKFGRPDLHFDDGTRLSLNATNNRTLIRAYGTRSEDWINKEIELSLGEVKYEGKTQESVVVKPVSPPIEKRPPPSKPRPRGDDIDDAIPF